MRAAEVVDFITLERDVRAAEVVDFITLERDVLQAVIVVVKVDYEGGGADLYSVPLVVSKDPGSNVRGEPGTPGGGANTGALLMISGRSGGAGVTLSDAL